MIDIKKYDKAIKEIKKTESKEELDWLIKVSEIINFKLDHNDLVIDDCGDRIYADKYFSGENCFNFGIYPKWKITKPLIKRVNKGINDLQEG